MAAPHNIYPQSGFSVIRNQWLTQSINAADVLIEQQRFSHACEEPWRENKWLYERAEGNPILNIMFSWVFYVLMSL